MKKLILLYVVSGILFTELHSQEEKLAPGDIGNPCPPPSCVVRATLHIDFVNFHKPRTECKTGFGICVKTHLQYTCGYPPNCLPGSVNNRQMLKVENGKVSGYFMLLDGKAEMHLPLSIKSHPEFTSTDLSQFSIEPNTVVFRNEHGIDFARAKAGNYPVKNTGYDLVIILDLEK